MTDDRRIINDIEAALSHDTRVDRDRCQLEIASEGGFVTLQGRENSDLERRAAENDCWYCPGLNDVENRLTPG